MSQIPPHTIPVRELRQILARNGFDATELELMNEELLQQHFNNLIQQQTLNNRTTIEDHDIFKGERCRHREVIDVDLEILSPITTRFSELSSHESASESSDGTDDTKKRKHSRSLVQPAISSPNIFAPTANRSPFIGRRERVLQGELFRRSVGSITDQLQTRKC